ncbi:MAG: hypothetical protein M1835_005190 [Candelina submexicana]|nr:MAG: hypothetical protein M1835_005190 [Candelina submexicana]
MNLSRVKPSAQNTQRQAQASLPQGIEKRPQQVLRRSARLQNTQQDSEAKHLLPSPPTTNPPDSKAPRRSPPPDPEASTPSCPPPEPEASRERRKRKRSQEVEASQGPSEKRPRAYANGSRPLAEIVDNYYSAERKVLQQTPQKPNSFNSVAHWARTSFWPEDLGQQGFGMSENPSSKRRSESTHRSQVLERLADHGIFMESSNLIQKDSKSLCQEYLKGNRKTVKTSVFTAKEFAEVLIRVRELNEPRIVRDVTPWIVPSAEVLWFRNELKLDYIGDALSVEWTPCATMGGKKPKPDYIAALRSSAYTKEEIDKLENYAQPKRPFRFTPELSYPFLMCEGKPGTVGLNEADRQNIHSASIAVQAIFALYDEAFGDTAPHRVQELYGKILVFSVSHDNDKFVLYGHFAVAESDTSNNLRFYRHPINVYSLTMNDGADLYKGYNFISNVYEKFGPIHRKRIKDAAARLPTPVRRTSLSFAASNMSVDESNPDQDSREVASQGEGQMMPPPSIPNTAERERIRMLEEQIAGMKEEQRRQTDEQRRQIDELRDLLKESLSAKPKGRGKN